MACRCLPRPRVVEYECLFADSGMLWQHRLRRLPPEVVDRRFSDVEFEEWISQTLLRVVMKRFVRSGFSKEYSRETGKEILFVVKKNQAISVSNGGDTSRT